MARYNLGRILPAFKGAYASGTVYEKMDIVYFNGSSWVATGTTSSEPSDNNPDWEKVANAGEKGEQGEKGEPGKDAPVYEEGFGIKIEGKEINAEVSWGERSGYTTAHGDTLVTSTSLNTSLSYKQDTLKNTKSMTVQYEDGSTETFNIYIQ